MAHTQLIGIITIMLAIVAGVILFKFGKRFASLFIWVLGLGLVCLFIATYGDPELLVGAGVRIGEFLREVLDFLKDLYRTVL